MYYYLLILHGDIEPELRGPMTEAERKTMAVAHRRADANLRDGLYPINIESTDPNLKISIPDEFLD